MVLISFREWLHSYKETRKEASEEMKNVLISFREWLHSYKEQYDAPWPECWFRFSSLSESGFIPTREEREEISNQGSRRSHLFQRVASFLHKETLDSFVAGLKEFSSLSESGFIPTYESPVF